MAKYWCIVEVCKNDDGIYDLSKHGIVVVVNKNLNWPQLEWNPALWDALRAVKKSRCQKRLIKAALQ